MRRKKGFTVIELMIVITIIAIIMAIAVPNLLRSRILANEKAAVGNLRAISTAQVSYHGAHKHYGDFSDLSGKIPPWLDGSFDDQGQRSGYNFVMDTVESNTYVCYADPISPGISANRYYRVDETGLIRYSDEGRPDETSTPIPDRPG